MSRTWKPTLLYALAHFAVDFGCAFAMFSACSTGPLGFLLYNFCAFAMQMPMGILADLLGKNRRFALLGTILVALICCLPSFGLVGCILLGLGNGLFHIGGGLDVLNLSGRRAAPLGVFVSPGAYGIYLGTILGNRASSPVPVVALLILACGGMLLWKSDQMPKNPPVEFPASQSFHGLPCCLPWSFCVPMAAWPAAFPGKPAFGLWPLFLLWFSEKHWVVSLPIGSLQKRLRQSLCSCLQRSFSAATLPSPAYWPCSSLI